MSSIVKMNNLRFEKYIHLDKKDKVKPHPRGLGLGLSSPASIRVISSPAKSEESSEGSKSKSKSKKSESVELVAGSIIELDFGIIRPQRYEALLSYSSSLYALGMVSGPSLIPSNQETHLKVTLQLFSDYSVPADETLVTVFLVD